MAAVISIISSKFLIASLNFAEDRRTTWARKLKKVCKERRMPEIYDIVEQRLVVHKSNAHYFPQDCGRKRDLKLAKHLHILMMQSGVASCCEQLIWLFTTCRCLAEANQVLDNALEVNVLSLGALISAHGNLGGGPTALDLYNTMLQLGMKCDRSIYIAAIKACTLILALEQGRLIHVHIINSSLPCDMFLGTNLLDMYAKCGTLEEACQVFDNLPNRDVVSWTALIAGYTQHAKSEIALHCFEEMQHQDIVPNAASYLSILKACSNIGALNQGRHIHQQIMSFKIQSNGYLESTLVDMYAKCGSLEEACKVFAKLPNPDVVSWGTMIAGCVQNDENILAVQIFERMQNNGVNPNRATFLSILKAYGNIGDIVHGRRIHVQIIDNGMQLDIAVLNTLVDMYAKCGALEEARKLFDKMATRDVVSWGAMLGCYAQHDGGDIVLKCFNQMQNEGIRPNKVIFLSLLKACGSIGSLVRGRQMHQQIIVNGFELDIAVGNTILDVYAKFGSLEEARKVFGELPYQNVVSWNAMIAGYAQHGEGVLALNYFDKMQNLAIKPNKVTFLCILKASGNIRDIKQTTKIHDQIIKSGMLMDVALGSALIDAYAKCGSLERAHKVFDKLSAGNVVSWNAIISAFLQHDRSHVVLEYFKKMQEINLEPDKVTFLGILKACSNIGAIDQGRYIHNKIKQSGIELDIVVGNAIIDMYAKCGSMKEACKVFNKLPNRDVVTWGAIIDGYGRIGNAALAFQYFYEMQQSGIKPDGITFIGILSACSHMGLLQEAYRYFISMTENHGFTPRTAHYNCMIDLFSHAGCFKEAEDLFSPHQDNICGLITLLSACRMHGNVELGRQCFHKVVC